MKTIRPLLHGGALAFLIPLLVACAASKPVVRTETVTVDRPVIVAVPAELTRVAPEPVLPAGPITNDDLADTIKRLQAWGRGLAGQLRKIGGLVPSETAK